MNEARAKAQELVETAESLLRNTGIPKKRSPMFYTDDSPETIEGFCNVMRVVRRLCLNAMKIVKSEDIIEKGEADEQGDCLSF